jgi:hypothetical protein
MDDDGSWKKMVRDGQRFMDGGGQRFLEGKERGV